MKYRITLINRQTMQTHLVDGYPVVVTTEKPEEMEEMLMRNRPVEHFYVIRGRVG